MVIKGMNRASGILFIYHFFIHTNFSLQINCFRFIGLKKKLD